MTKRPTRDLVHDFRTYADNPLQGQDYVPIHRDTLRAAADEIERLRAALAAEAKFWERHGPGADTP